MYKIDLNIFDYSQVELIFPPKLILSEVRYVSFRFYN